MLVGTGAPSDMLVVQVVIRHKRYTSNQTSSRPPEVGCVCGSVNGVGDGLLLAYRVLYSHTD
jgi:hypothetical protein